jgi:hypothetical protein
MKCLLKLSEEKSGAMKNFIAPRRLAGIVLN